MEGYGRFTTGSQNEQFESHWKVLKLLFSTPFYTNRLEKFAWGLYMMIAYIAGIKIINLPNSATEDDTDCFLLPNETLKLK